ncbi:hypothetical protein GF336_06945 [Candidatus Woesearchaeota archaeon]|nr:hypothetical protein [Candidatus Woesearchaeota archaeon]
MRGLKDRTSQIFIFFIGFYGLQLVGAMFIDSFAPVWDIAAAVFLISVFFVMHKKTGFKPAVPFLIGIGFFPHILGLYDIFGAGITLYGAELFNYHYDWIVHSFGMFCYTLAFCSISFDHLIKGLRSKILVLVFVLFFMNGVGAFNESLEYVGFDVIGYGEGFLEFGDGDASPVGGPWENSSMDVICNLFGILFGLGVFLTKSYLPDLDAVL